MASTSKNVGTGLEFPGKHVYVRSTNEDTENPEHQARVQSWIQDYEKSRQVFVFPTQTVRTFATLLLVLGLLSLIVQVLLTASSLDCVFSFMFCWSNLDCFLFIALCIRTQSSWLWYLDRPLLCGHGCCWLGCFYEAEYFNVMTNFC